MLPKLIHNPSAILIIPFLTLLLFFGVSVHMQKQEIFNVAIEKLLKREGGYANDPSDPGGETKFGISKRSYPSLDIKKLTVNDAIEIYFRDYWLKNKLDKIENPEIGSKIFDIMVNIGHHNGTRIVQRALRACSIKLSPDVSFNDLIDFLNGVGKDSVQTLQLLSALRSEVAGYYRTLAHVKKPLNRFLEGWLKRAYDE